MSSATWRSARFGVSRRVRGEARDAARGVSEPPIASCAPCDAAGRSGSTLGSESLSTRCKRWSVGALHAAWRRCGCAPHCIFTRARGRGSLRSALAPTRCSRRSCTGRTRPRPQCKAHGAASSGGARGESSACGRPTCFRLRRLDTIGVAQRLKRRPKRQRGCRRCGEGSARELGAACFCARSRCRSRRSSMQSAKQRCSACKTSVGATSLLAPRLPSSKRAIATMRQRACSEGSVAALHDVGARSPRRRSRRCERDRRAERTRGSALGSARGSAPGSAQRRGGHRGEEVRPRRTLRARGSARGRDHGDRAKAQRARSALARRSIGSARSSARGNARDSALLRVVLR